MPSLEPLSSAPLAGLIWEIDDGASAIFGLSPFEAEPEVPEVPAPPIFGKRLASILAYVRTTLLPGVWDSANTTQIILIRRVRSVDPDDPLDISYTEETQEVYGMVRGPSTENMMSGLLSITDFEATVPAVDVDEDPLTPNEAVRINGVRYDIVGIQPFPKVPDPVAWRYLLRRAGR